MTTGSTAHLPVTTVKSEMLTTAGDAAGAGPETCHGLEPAVLIGIAAAALAASVYQYQSIHGRI